MTSQRVKFLLKITPVALCYDPVNEPESFRHGFNPDSAIRAINGVISTYQLSKSEELTDGQRRRLRNLMVRCAKVVLFMIEWDERREPQGRRLANNRQRFTTIAAALELSEQELQALCA